MITKKQFRVLVWLVIILLALNISAVGTILWLRFSGPVPGREPAECSYKVEKKHFRMHDEIIKKEVGFDRQQLKAFRQLRDKHFDEIRQITAEIQKTRELQFTAIRDNNTVPGFTDSLSIRTGELHQQWAASSAEFLISARKLCSEEQQEKLFGLFQKSRMKHGLKSDKRNYRKAPPPDMPCD